ncbi:hypothetical protein NOC27_210 [Nitrosococcus oceani AFC27]|nr:hypothetical protein NOC27_210 [Nitrosococcus oceani AFC27]
MGSSPSLAGNKAEYLLTFGNPSGITVAMGIKACLIHVNQVFKAHHAIFGAELFAERLPFHSTALAIPALFFLRCASPLKRG